MYPMTLHVESPIQFLRRTDSTLSSARDIRQATVYLHTSSRAASLGSWIGRK